MQKLKVVHSLNPHKEQEECAKALSLLRRLLSPKYKGNYCSRIVYLIYVLASFNCALYIYLQLHVSMRRWDVIHNTAARGHPPPIYHSVAKRPTHRDALMNLYLQINPPCRTATSDFKKPNASTFPQRNNPGTSEPILRRVPASN